LWHRLTLRFTITNENSTQFQAKSSLTVFSTQFPQKFNWKKRLIKTFRTFRLTSQQIKSINISINCCFPSLFSFKFCTKKTTVKKTHTISTHEKLHSQELNRKKNTFRRETKQKSNEIFYYFFQTVFLAPFLFETKIGFEWEKYSFWLDGWAKWEFGEVSLLEVSEVSALSRETKKHAKCHVTKHA
jgi:hypothetical protein